MAGESGSGKTTSLRNLDPKNTFIIDADRKGLSWKGWKSQYNSEAKNYIQTSDVDKIRTLLKSINEKAQHIKTVVVDTLNTIMVDDEVKRMKEKGYDKWIDLAQCVWELVSEAHLLRDDLTVVFMAHTQTERDDSGYYFTRIKTSGRKLEKICLESKFTTVLIAKCIDGRYIFETRAKNSTAKSPMGCFDEFEIDNDLAKVIQRLEEYEK
ncbi:AAA family ATPase [Pseudoclostridium thermosuccinogenes]|uniref:AAA family ATPase n=1 Tax=Clostridium thermosuccinogenes TaxID=84032 RepID=UPI002FD96014